jgi:hypothetical protein
MKNVTPVRREASSDKLAQLDLSERLFLWGFRSMAQHHRCGCPIVAAILQVYVQFQVEDAVGSLDALIEVFASTAHTAIEIHCPNCPCISESETFLLRAMAAAQSSDLNMARRELERWLPELAADWTLGPVCGIAAIFQAAGMTLPLRTVETTEMHETEAMRSWPIGSQALH